MKPKLLKLANEAAHSFNIRQDKSPNINSRWHYHGETELIHFHKGSGTQFVGDHIQRFRHGDLVLVGTNLPHYWKYDDSSLNFDKNAEPYSTVVHFYPNFWSEQFLNLPENKIIKTTLENAERGIQVLGNTKLYVHKLLDEMMRVEGPKRIILLMEVLLAIGNCRQKKLLSSIGFNYNFDEADKDRLNLIYDYSLSNFKGRISLEDIADVANLSPNSFCRYFKSRTRKTYSQFLNEIRIGNACKLLIEDKINIKQICYESGFNNFSSFHTCFKKITGKRPLSYKHEFLSNEAV